MGTVCRVWTYYFALEKSNNLCSYPLHMQAPVSPHPGPVRVLLFFRRVSISVRTRDCSCLPRPLSRAAPGEGMMSQEGRRAGAGRAGP